MIYIWSPITYHSHKIDCLIITFKYEIPMKHSNQKQSNTHDTKNQYHQHHASMVIFVTYLYLSVLRILSTWFSYLYLIRILKIYTVANNCISYVLIRYILSIHNIATLRSYIYLIKILGNIRKCAWRNYLFCIQGQIFNGVINWWIVPICANFIIICGLTHICKSPFSVLSQLMNVLRF